MRDGEAGGGGGYSGDDGGDRDDDRRRTLVNLSALVFLIGLVVGCVWLAHVLAENAKLEDCLMSGRTNCNPIDVSH
jgi:hypothetical protein